MLAGIRDLNMFILESDERESQIVYGLILRFCYKILKCLYVMYLISKHIYLPGVKCI